MTLGSFDMTLYVFVNLLAIWYDKMIQSQLNIFYSRSRICNFFWWEMVFWDDRLSARCTITLRTRNRVYSETRLLLHLASTASCQCQKLICFLGNDRPFKEYYLIRRTMQYKNEFFRKQNWFLMFLEGNVSLSQMSVCQKCRQALQTSSLRKQSFPGTEKGQDSFQKFTDIQ